MLKFIIYCLNVLAAVGGFQDVSPVAEPTIEPTTEPTIEPTIEPTPEPTPELKEVVAIQIDGVPKCLGAFVITEDEPTPRFIATAAHCVYGVRTSRLTVEQLQVKRVMVHPYYWPPSPDYDIALLRISGTTDETRGLLLKNVLPSGTNLKAFDWGLKEDINASLEDRQSCRAKMANHTVVSKRMLCVNTESNSVGDGSPLVQLIQEKNQIPKKCIVGVGSYYVRGNSEKYPKIFTSTTNSEIYSFVMKYID